MATTKTIEKTTAKATTLAEKIAEAFNAHLPLVEARAKLKELESSLATLQSEFDQLNSECNRSSESLADEILKGDDLSNRAELFANRESLRQRIEAYTVAIARQKTAVINERALASPMVCQSIGDDYRQRLEAYQKAIADLKQSLGQMVEFRDAIGGQGLSHRFEFFGLAEVATFLRSVEHTLRKFAK